jgi:hypothetical protein
MRRFRARQTPAQETESLQTAEPDYEQLRNAARNETRNETSNDLVTLGEHDRNVFSRAPAGTRAVPVPSPKEKEEKERERTEHAVTPPAGVDTAKAQRLETYVRRTGYLYEDDSLRADLHEKGAGYELTARLLAIAQQVREAARAPASDDATADTDSIPARNGEEQGK